MVVALAYRYSSAECAEGLYSLQGKYCVTAKECYSYGENYRAYKLLKMCVPAIMYYRYSGNNIVLRENDEYECNDGYYISFHNYRVTCLKAEDLNDSMYQVDGKNVYADEWFCGGVFNMLIFKDEKTRQCITK